jgi:cytochrome c peroxidase
MLMTATNLHLWSRPMRHALSWIACLSMVACGGGDNSSATESAQSLPTETAQATTPTFNPALVQLGQRLFVDRNLSEPAGTACVACHQPARGFSGNNGSGLEVAQGSITGVFGLRNPMSNAYQGLVPSFHFVVEDDGKLEAVGGHFWDGRAATLAEQALGPFLNPAEMNNPNAESVVRKVAASNYANQFRAVFGANSLSQTATAFQQIGEAIAAFQLAALQSYSSKYDAFVRGQARLSDAEARGLALFQDPNRANCAGCHTMNPSSGKPEDSPFSDFSYYANAIPRNTRTPANANPNFYDLGLCGPDRSAPALPANAPAGLTPESLCGKFRMPSLRNVAERPAYMHNGFFRSLRDVVRFYATRNSNLRDWYGPTALPNDLPVRYWGNIEISKPPFNRNPADGPVLNNAEINDIVAFLRTLSDGYDPVTGLTTTPTFPTLTAPPNPQKRPPAPASN